MKKVLLKVQGINVISDYMTKELEISGVDTSCYDRVVYLNTEKEFDKILNILPGFMKNNVYTRRIDTKKRYKNNETETKLKFIDYAVDLWAFFIDKDIYDKVTSKVRNAASKYQSQGYEVDIFAHSLGTMISLHSGASVNNFFCLACPLGIGNFFLKSMINWHMGKIKKPMHSKNTLLVWGTKDLVSKDTDDKVIAKIREHTDKLVKFKTDSGHSLLAILKELRTIGKFELFVDYFLK
jgi:hypothetical protein